MGNAVISKLPLVALAVFPILNAQLCKCFILNHFIIIAKNTAILGNIRIWQHWISLLLILDSYSFFASFCPQVFGNATEVRLHVLVAVVISRVIDLLLANSWSRTIASLSSNNRILLRVVVMFPLHAPELLLGHRLSFNGFVSPVIIDMLGHGSILSPGTFYQNATLKMIIILFPSTGLPTRVLWSQNSMGHAKLVWWPLAWICSSLHQLHCRATPLDCKSFAVCGTNAVQPCYNNWDFWPDSWGIWWDLPGDHKWNLANWVCFSSPHIWQCVACSTRAQHDTY